MKYKHKASTSDQSPQTRPDYVIETWDHPQPSPKQRSMRKGINIGCSILGILLLCILVVGSIYLLMPFRTNLLILGIDRTPEGTDIGRSDTNILFTVLPLRPYVGLISIPRDLWVTIPGVGENRINTAHYFAESQVPGSGPAAAMETIRHNFDVPINHYLRIKFDGVTEIVDSLGGLDVELSEPVAGLSSGKHHLSGDQALVFLRDRQGTDDFHRMGQAQIFVTEFFEQLIQPSSWLRIPRVLNAVNQAIDTNLPIWIWPRIAFAMLRSGVDGVDNRVMGRDYVTPYITPDGAQVLLPQWELIMPLIEDVFGN
jgi:LCP family protein required for cell wall assembly